MDSSTPICRRCQSAKIKKLWKKQNPERFAAGDAAYKRKNRVTLTRWRARYNKKNRVKLARAAIKNYRRNRVRYQAQMRRNLFQEDRDEACRQTSE